MPNFNPSAPEVLGNEWLMTHDQKSRVWGGAVGRRQRIISTTTETISALDLSVSVNPLLAQDTHTIIDVCEEGSEDTPTFVPVELVPTSDVTINNWKTDAGGTTNLYQRIDESATRFPGPATADWIETKVSNDSYTPAFGVTAFDTGGQYEFARIGFVSILAIYRANTGFRKLRTRMLIGGNTFLPAGGDLRDVSGFGATYGFWYGELNPNTEKPWTPADIVQFGAAGSSRAYVQSYSATTKNWPQVLAFRLCVYCVQTENRKAVGVWRRPETLTAGLNNIETDALITVPGGAANWSKATAKNYTFFFRQSVCPSLYGPVNADDVRWNGAYQDLGPAGQPDGPVFPLSSSGDIPGPGNVLASEPVSYDQYGRPETEFVANSRAAYAIAMKRQADGLFSVDSQPYRLDVTDLQTLSSTSTVGQHIVPGASASYSGVRFPIIPPSTGNPTLTAKIRRVSDSVQMGGTYTISASAVRAMAAASGGWRFVHGFLSSAASLVSGTAYEIQLSTSSGGNWIVPMANCSLAPTTSFGGTTSGAYIGGSLQTSRELSIVITKAPDPPTAVTAVLTDVAFTDAPIEGVSTVKHVTVSWTLPAVGMGGNFKRYEIERQTDGNGVWERVANVTNSALTSWIDHEATRNVTAQYRMRAMGLDGKFSGYNQSSTVTPTTGGNPIGSLAILTSNFAQSSEVVYKYLRESTYTVLSSERDEMVAIHGADYQIVFMEAEDRGIGWRTVLYLKRAASTGKAGPNIFGALVDLSRSLDVPYVCVMDERANKFMGHVKIFEVPEEAPGYRYAIGIDVIPTHTTPVPVTVT